MGIYYLDLTSDYLHTHFSIQQPLPNGQTNTFSLHAHFQIFIFSNFQIIHTISALGALTDFLRGEY